MKTKKLVSLVILFAMLCTLFISCKKDEDEENDLSASSGYSPEEIGEIFIDNLFAESYDFIIDNIPYTLEMTSFMDKPSLKELNRQLNEIHGNFEEIDSFTSDKAEEGGQMYDRIAYLCQGESTKYILRIVFDKNKKIAGINYLEYESRDNLEGKTGDRIENVTGDIKLPGILQYKTIHEETAYDGTITTVELPMPEKLVLIMPGSGPNDIDGTVGVLKPYEDLANGLVDNGLAVYRFEKRTYFYQNKPDKLDTLSMTPYEEEIEDMLSAIRYFMKDTKYNFKEIYVSGHSLGGYLLPKLYSYLSEDEKAVIGGFIFLAPSASKIEDLIVKQLEFFANEDGNVSQDEKNEIEKYKTAREKIKAITKDTQNTGEYHIGASVDYYKYLLDYDPVKAAQNINGIKMTFLFAENDKNVDADEYNIWKNGVEGKAEFKLFGGLNHSFMPGTGYPSDAYKPSNVTDEVINYISDFIFKK